jgi:hypothetical protein
MLERTVLNPESRSDDRMPAGRSEAGYWKKVLDGYSMTSQLGKNAGTTKKLYRVSIAIWPIERRVYKVDVQMKSRQDDSRSQAKDKRLSTFIIKLKNTA